LFLLLAVLLGATAPPTPPYPALGQEIEGIVGRDFYDPERAARWVRENAGYAEGIMDAAAFRRETRRRLALLGASHTEYYALDDPGRWDLASLFESYLQQPTRTESLGLGLVEREDGWFVARVFAGGPAEAAGVRRGDRIVTADSAPFHPKRSFSGKSGRPVTLEIQSRRGGPTRTVSVVPRLVDSKEEWLETQRAGTRIVEHQGRRIAYAPLWSCAGEQFRDALAEALAGDLAQAEALVIDFRGGWGGCSPDFVNLFNPMVSELVRIDREGVRSPFAGSWRKPLVVLIDGGSRSGKEVVARAIQRHRLGTLVGERTAGAVLAGRPYLLADGSLLFLAVHDIVAEGERLEGVGVKPDVEVVSDLLYTEGRDPQLERALEVAAGLASKGL
jgi:carboxyl-terminal processing protease